jgi:hypothetical protein
MKEREAFFIGWSRELDATLRRFLAPLALLLLLGFPAAGFLLGVAAEDHAGPGFATIGGTPRALDLPEGGTVEGVVIAGPPTPLLRLPPDAAHPRGRTLLLSGDGKVGVAWDVPALAGRLVAAEGFLLRRGDITMLVAGSPPTPLDRPAPALPPVEHLGRWRISGEICDGKCAAGGMLPGTGLAHRACATLCLDGDIPAVFVPTHPVAGEAMLLLAAADGTSPWPAFRAHVARRVTLEGEVERHGDLLLFKASPP